MKKKWLIGLISALMAVTLCFGFAACGGDKGGDDDKTTLKAVLDNLRSQYNDTTNTPKDYTLTTSVSIAGKQYAVSWTAEAVTEGITLSDYVVIGEPDTATKTVLVDITATTTDINYKITASATVGKESGNVTFERTIPATIVGDVNIDFADYELGDAVKLGDAFNTASLEEAIKSIVDVPADFGAVTKVSNVYAGNSANNGGPSDYRLKDGFLKTGTSDYNGEIELTFNKFIEKVEIIAIGWSSSDKITINDGTETTLSGTDFTTVSYTVENAATAKVTNVSIVTKKRTLIFKIAVTFVEGAQRLEYAYEYNESGKAWTHKKTEVNNRVDEVAEEPCTPVNNVCKYCEHEFPQEEIVTELFKLGSGESLPGTYELTGYVTKVVELPGQYNNATVWMLVGEKEIEVYHCTAADDALYAKLDVGAEITVQGSLTNHGGTYEFTTGCSFTEVKDKADSASLEDAAKLSILTHAIARGLTGVQTSYDAVTGETPIQLLATFLGSSLTWSVTEDANIKIEDNKVSILALPQIDTADLAKTVTVNLGDESDTIQFIVVAPLSTTGDGTAAKPFTVADAKKIGNNLDPNTNKGYYQKAGAAAQVYFKGYITDVGKVNGKYGFKNIKIADSLTAAATDQLLVYNINYGGPLGEAPSTTPAASPFAIGEQIVVYGFLQQYNASTLEVTNNGSVYPTLSTWKKVPQLGVDEQLAALEKSYTLAKTVYSEVKTFDLPTTVEDMPAISIAWTDKTATNASVSGNKLTVTNVPAEDAAEEIQLTATFSGTGTEKTFTKTFTISIKEAPQLILTAADLGLTGSYTNGTGTVSGVAFSWSQCMTNTQAIQMNQSKPSIIWNTAALSGNIKKVVFIWSTAKQESGPSSASTMKVEFSTTADFTEGANTVSQTVSIPAGSGFESVATTALSGEYQFVRITAASGSAVYFSSIEIW